MPKKYTYEFKLQVVNEYLSGKGSYEFLANKFGISDKSLLRNWVSLYQKNGQQALFRKREKGKYDFQFKRHAVQWYLTTEISYRELALQLDISTPALLCRWVSDFRRYGIDGISDKPKGRSSVMPKKKEFPKKEPVEAICSDTERIKELEQKVLYLEIENAYLKELRRLRLEEEAKKKSQESYAVSEENTD